jgi:hypothetical protein
MDDQNSDLNGIGEEKGRKILRNSSSLSSVIRISRRSDLYLLRPRFSRGGGS